MSFMIAILNIIACLLLLKYFCYMVVFCFVGFIDYKKSTKYFAIIETNNIVEMMDTSSTPAFTDKNNIKTIIKAKVKNEYELLYRVVSWKISEIPFMRIRMFLYKHILHMKLSKNVSIHYKAEIRCGYKISIGCGSIIGDNCILDGRNGLTIGDNVNISSNCSIYTMQHDVNDVNFSGDGGPVKIENRAWISSNTVVLPSVTVHEGAVLACGAVATKDLESYSINGGIPAKKIGSRNKKLQYNFKNVYEFL